MVDGSTAKIGFFRKLSLFLYKDRQWLKDKSQLRHAFKAITWRVIASFTTFVLAWLFFKDDPLATQKATGLALAEFVLKLFLYYFHERIWFKLPLGRQKEQKNG